MTETALDRAVARAGDDPASDGGVWDALLNAELHLLLEEEPKGDRLKPVLMPLETGPAALAFDLAERLAAVAGGGAPYAAMPGRALATMLAGTGVSLAVNPGAETSELFYGPEALAWAAEFLAGSVAEEEAQVAALGAPRAATPALLAALDAKLAALGPALAEAWLTGAGDGLLLVARLGAGDARGVAQALGETAALAGDGALDIAFAGEDSALLTRARAVGLGFELPKAPEVRRTAPGADPDRPPKLL